MTHADADPHAGGAAKRKLPIGIRTFREIREEGCCYVDKTARARRLVESTRGRTGANKFSRVSRFSGLNNLVLEFSRDARNVVAFEVEAG